MRHEMLSLLNLAWHALGVRDTPIFRRGYMSDKMAVSFRDNIVWLWLKSFLKRIISSKAFLVIFNAKTQGHMKNI